MSSLDPSELKAVAAGPWWGIGRFLKRVRDERIWAGSYRSFEAWIKDASMILEKSPRQVRRYLTSLEYAEELVAAGRADSIDFMLTVPEVTIDCLSRLDKTSPSAADNLIKGDLSKITYRTVLIEIKNHSQENIESLGPRQYARWTSTNFLEACRLSIARNMKVLGKEYSRLLDSKRLPFGLSVEFVLPDQRGKWCDACKIIYATSNDPIEFDMIYEAAWASRFFRKLWMIASAASTPHLLEQMELANLPSVGVAGIDPNNRHLEIVRSPVISKNPELTRPREALLKSRSRWEK